MLEMVIKKSVQPRHLGALQTEAQVTWTLFFSACPCHYSQWHGANMGTITIPMMTIGLMMIGLMCTGRVSTSSAHMGK